MITDFVKNLTDITAKFAAFAGFDDSHMGSTHGASGKFKAEFERTTQGAKSLSDYLSYRYFDESSSLFFNDEGWVSFFMELTPIVGSNSTLTKNLEHFFNDEMPQGSWMQFLLVASNDVTSIIGNWKRSRTSANPALKKLAERREKFLNKMSSDYRNSSGRVTRDYKLYLVFNQKCSGDSSEYNKVKIFMQNLKQKLDSINLDPRVLEVDNLLSLVKEILELDLIRGQNGIKPRPRKYDKKKVISDQILTPLISHEVLEDSVVHRDTKLTSRCYFVSELPIEFSLNEMIGLLGDGARDNLAIPARFILSYIVASNLAPAAQSAIVQKGQRIIEADEKFYSRHDRDIKRESAEWKDINDRAKNGEKFLTEYFQIMLTAPTDFIDEAEQSLFSLYNILNWRLEVNRHFQLPALLSILPMQAPLVWSHLTQFKLVRQALSSEVIAKLPIHSEWKGVPEPAVLLVGRRGQLFHWNPFYRISSGNYNICVFGPSGSGKSVFLQELATNMMAQNAQVFILDIGQSFKNICNLLDGETIQFGKNCDIVLNPFAGFTDNIVGENRVDAISYAKGIISSMCGAKGDAQKEGIVEEAISEGLKKYGGKLDITRLANMITDRKSKKNSEIANSLSDSLFSYTENGIYGKFFGSQIEGAKETKFDKQLTVFEFEEIKSNPLLLGVILQIIGMQISMQFLTGDRSKRFVLIVDEAWMILDYAAKFLSDLARTVRKYGGSLVTCVQNFNDLTGGEHQRSILENSTWTVLLKQDEKGINSFKASEAFKDKIELIKSISISPGKYAEGLFCATGVYVVGRIVLDDFSKTLYSTDAAIFKDITDLTSAGISTEEAVSILTERKYGTV